jgi:hypothetical protein
MSTSRLSHSRSSPFSSGSNQTYSISSGALLVSWSRRICPIPRQVPS